MQTNPSLLPPARGRCLFDEDPNEHRSNPALQRRERQSSKCYRPRLDYRCMPAAHVALVRTSIAASSAVLQMKTSLCLPPMLAMLPRESREVPAIKVQCAATARNRPR